MTSSLHYLDSKSLTAEFRKWYQVIVLLHDITLVGLEQLQPWASRPKDDGNGHVQLQISQTMALS
jgi:hypothetical protein